MDTTTYKLNNCVQLFVQWHNGHIYTEIQLRENDKTHYGDYCIPYDILRRAKMPSLIEDILQHINKYGIQDAIEFFEDLML
jgi:hypothetical protein